MPVKVTLDAYELELIAQAVECGIEHGKPFSSDAKALRELCGHFRTMAKKDRDETKAAKRHNGGAFWYEVIDYRPSSGIMGHHLFDNKSNRDVWIKRQPVKHHKHLVPIHRAWSVENLTEGLANNTVTVHD